MDIINEGKAKAKVHLSKVVSKHLPVFYNPLMEFNRTVSVYLLNSIDNREMQLALPLEASGIRGIRFLKELPKDKIKSISMNDINPEAVRMMKVNLKLNKINSKSKIQLFNKDANIFILESKGFDYIDIDPFGSPNIFLDSAIKRLGRNGILAVTATDTGCLAGSFPAACRRKYWAVPQRNSTMHENGLRILIRKIQLIGSDHSKALVPIYSYSKDHYFRTFLRCEKGKRKVDHIIRQHGMLNDAGPLWLGQLFDRSIAKKISEQAPENRFLKLIASESKISIPGFYNLPKLAKKYKFEMMNIQKLIKKIRKAGYKASLTHFAESSIRSDIPLEKLLKILK
jgi:tRNA (guanine26-N2/guanine27-N2)-dimethyltransferase